MDTPRLLGFTILELSKLHIYKTHYGYYKKNYGDKAKLLFTDTDSLCYLIETYDLIKDMTLAKPQECVFDLESSLTPAVLELSLIHI